MRLWLLAMHGCLHLGCHSTLISCLVLKQAPDRGDASGVETVPCLRHPHTVSIQADQHHLLPAAISSLDPSQRLAGFCFCIGTVPSRQGTSLSEWLGVLYSRNFLDFRIKRVISNKRLECYLRSSVHQEVEDNHLDLDPIPNFEKASMDFVRGHTNQLPNPSSARMKALEQYQEKTAGGSEKSKATAT